MAAALNKRQVSNREISVFAIVRKIPLQCTLKKIEMHIVKVLTYVGPCMQLKDLHCWSCNSLQVLHVMEVVPKPKLQVPQQQQIVG